MAGQLTIDTLKASSGVLSVANGMTGIAKAWVNFAGNATPTINASFNVSSVTYNSTGNWTVTFSTSLPNSNYAGSLQTGYNLSSNTAYNMLFSPTTSAFSINHYEAGVPSNLSSGSNMSAVIFSS